MKIELKNLKQKFDEGRLDSFATDVWVDGTPAFHAIRDWINGPMAIRVIPEKKFAPRGESDRWGPSGSENARGQALLDLAGAWAKTLPPRVVNFEMQEAMDLGLLIDWLVGEAILENDLRRLTHQKTAFILIDENKVCALHTLDLVFSESTAAAIIDSNKKHKRADTVILNGLSVAVALRVIADPTLALTLLPNDEEESFSPGF